MNNMFPGGIFGVNGHGYTTPPKTPDLTPILSPNEEEFLRKQQGDVDAFNLKISETDLIKAKCPHRYNGTNQPAFRMIDNKHLQCAICGKVVDSTELNPDEVDKAYAIVCNVNEWLKYYASNVSPEIMGEVTKFFPIIEKLPKMYRVFYDTLMGYKNMFNNPDNSGIYGYNGYGLDTWAMYGSFGNPPVQYGQPPYGTPPVQYGQPPYGNPPVQYGQPPTYGGNQNPMACGSPNANPAAAPTIPTVPEVNIPDTPNNGEVVQQATFNV